MRGRTISFIVHHSFIHSESNPSHRFRFFRCRTIPFFNRCWCMALSFRNSSHSVRILLLWSLSSSLFVLGLVPSSYTSSLLSSLSFSTFGGCFGTFRNTICRPVLFLPPTLGNPISKTKPGDAGGVVVPVVVMFATAAASVAARIATSRNSGQIRWVVSVKTNMEPNGLTVNNSAKNRNCDVRNCCTFSAIQYWHVYTLMIVAVGVGGVVFVDLILSLRRLLTGSVSSDFVISHWPPNVHVLE